MFPSNSIEVSIQFRICITLEIVSNIFKILSTIKTMFVWSNIIKIPDACHLAAQFNLAEIISDVSLTLA